MFGISDYAILSAYVIGYNNYKTIPSFNLDNQKWGIQVYDYDNNPVNNTSMDIRFFVAKCNTMGVI